MLLKTLTLLLELKKSKFAINEIKIIKTKCNFKN